jgi:hypothetical protein
LDQADDFSTDRSGAGHFVGHRSLPVLFATTGKKKEAITETQSKSGLIITLQIDGRYREPAFKAKCS